MARRLKLPFPKRFRFCRAAAPVQDSAKQKPHRPAMRSLSQSPVGIEFRAEHEKVLRKQMGVTMKKMLVLGMAAMTDAGALCATSAMAAHDDFDRANLGTKWLIMTPNLFISYNQLKGDSLALGYDKKSVSASKVSATVYLNGTDLEYGAVA